MKTGFPAQQLVYHKDIQCFYLCNRENNYVTLTLQPFLSLLTVRPHSPLPPIRALILNSASLIFKCQFTNIGGFPPLAPSLFFLFLSKKDVRLLASGWVFRRSFLQNSHEQSCQQKKNWDMSCRSEQAACSLAETSITLLRYQPSSAARFLLPREK